MPFFPLSTAGTPYEGGLFRVKLVLGKDFPAVPPKGKAFFVYVVYLVLFTGRVLLCVSTAVSSKKSILSSLHVSIVYSSVKSWLKLIALCLRLSILYFTAKKRLKLLFGRV